MDINYIYTKVRDKQSYINGWKEMKRASVIVPIVNVKGKLCILFEVRSKNMRKHPGDVCFPGGLIEENETPMKAALREIREEVGLKSIDIIKELDILVRHHKLIIHPFLAEVKDLSELNINKDEVDSIFYVPIDDLLKMEPLVLESRLLTEAPENFPYDLVAAGKSHKFPKGVYKVSFYRYDKKVIWGITAAILENFIDIIK